MQQRKVSNTYKFIALSGLLLLLTAWGCSPTRRVQENQKMLNKVKIEADDKSVDISEASDYLQQKPNRKLLGFWRFYLQVYNLVDPEKALRDHKRRLDNKKARQQKRDTRHYNHCVKMQDRYKKKGKIYKCKVYDSDVDRIEAKPFREWIQGIGEAPVIYDTLLTSKSVFQLKQYLFNNGYFFATVKDSVADAGRKKANLFFRIKAGHQYIVDTIKYVATDTVLQDILNKDKGDKKVFAGKPFDTEALSDEQDRISELIKSKGYFFFSNEFVKVSADTNKGNYKTTVSFVIKNPQVVTGKSGEDSLAEGRHILYKLGTMTVNMGYDPTLPEHAAYDSVTYNNSVYYYPPAKKPMFRPKTLDYHIFLRKDSIYSDSKLDITLNRLSDLRNFKFINIQFNPVPMVDSTDGKGILNYDILLTPSMRRAYALEWQGTNTGGNLGIGGSFSFINKNLFRGEEWLEFKIRGALEFQRLVNDSIGTNAKNLFNTQEYGASLTLNIPRGVWPINYFVKDPLKNPRTAITTAYNFQNRPQYDRRAYTLSFGWNWRQNKYMTITYNPVELNFLNATLEAEYKATLPYVLLRSFDNAFVDAGRVSIIWTNQIPDKRKNYVFWRLGAESAGLLLNSVGIKKISIGNIAEPTKTAQYLRTDFEIYPNFYFNDKNAMALRAYVGIGVPYGNTDRTMPFAKAFFAGGSNGMRAWLQRSLGPGNFSKSNTTNIDQVGDIKFEFNAEYRVKLFSFLEPALFVDVGNIWLLINDPQRPGGKFGITRFYKQLGVDYGIGLRLDLSFFLLRLDFARRLVDPGGEYGGDNFLSPFRYDKYVPDPDKPGETKWKNPVVFQLGIGYPF